MAVFTSKRYEFCDAVPSARLVEVGRCRGVERRGRAAHNRFKTRTLKFLVEND
jgi:hypothetical protein